MPCACTAADMEITGAQLRGQDFLEFFAFLLYISPLKIPEGISLHAGVQAPKIC